MQDETSTQKCWYCLACGAWQQRTSPCDVCNSKRLTPAESVGSIDTSTGTTIDSGAVRVLIDIELRSDGQIRASRLYTERLAPIRHDTRLLSELDKKVRDRLVNRVNVSVAWAELHASLTELVTKAVGDLIRPRLLTKDSKVDVELSIRLLQLNQNLNLPPNLLFPWLEVITLKDALARVNALLKLDELKTELYGSRLSLNEGGERLQLGICAPIELVVDQVTLCLKDKPSEVLEEFNASTFLVRERMTSVLDVRLKSPTLWRLSPSSSAKTPAVELQVSFQGVKDKTLRVDVPCGDLGLRETLVDVFLDLGSTTTKYITRVGEQLSPARTKSTNKLSEEWSLTPYDKKRLLSDGTAGEWSRWIATLLPALRRYAAREHRGYLRRIHLAIPQSGPLNVNALSSAVAQRQLYAPIANGLNATAINALRERAISDAVGFEAGGKVVCLVPEHKAVANHYLEPIRVLQDVAKNYKELYKKNEDDKKSKEAKKVEWNNQRKKKDDYDKKGIIHQIFNKSPVVGVEPIIPESLMTPTEWMERLIKYPDILNSVLILDVGGLSVDIAVLESETIHADYSKSDISCGGEQVTRKFSEQLEMPYMTSEEGTREKGRLGVAWSTPNTAHLPIENRIARFGGRQQRAYREASLNLYDSVISDILGVVARYWKGKNRSHCIIILTGGGSRNPHFQDVVSEKIAGAGLDTYIIDANYLYNTINQARNFKEPLPDLNSPSIKLFTDVHSWAQVQGAEYMSYDKYAVLGGLLACSENK